MRIYTPDEMLRCNGQRFLVVMARPDGTYAAELMTIGDSASCFFAGLLGPRGRAAFGILESDLIAAALEHAPEEKARGEAIRAEIARKAAKRAAALAKLDEEERELLGVLA